MLTILACLCWLCLVRLVCCVFRFYSKETLHTRYFLVVTEHVHVSCQLKVEYHICDVV